MNLNQELIEIERTLWTNDVEIYGRTFLPDAVIIFPEIGRIDLEFALNALREENAARHCWAQVNEEKQIGFGEYTFQDPLLLVSVRKIEKSGVYFNCREK